MASCPNFHGVNFVLEFTQRIEVLLLQINANFDLFTSIESWDEIQLLELLDLLDVIWCNPIMNSFVNVDLNCCTFSVFWSKKSDIPQLRIGLWAPQQGGGAATTGAAATGAGDSCAAGAWGSSRIIPVLVKSRCKLPEIWNELASNGPKQAWNHGFRIS